MTDHPIIFSGAMVLALLAGRKTMTRRLLYVKRKARNGMIPATATMMRGHPPPHGIGPSGFPHAIGVGEYWTLSPWSRVAPGDRLYVREEIEASGALVQYVADRRTTHLIWPAHWKRLAQPGMLMPRAFSRLTLTVTATKIERLHDISDIDAQAEGVAPLPQQDANDPSAWWESAPGENQARSAAACFAKLWNSLHGAGAWEANPEVVALRFTVERRNIDAVAAE